MYLRKRQLIGFHELEHKEENYGHSCSKTEDQSYSVSYQLQSEEIFFKIIMLAKFR